jgi:hypothetical protein
MKDLLGQENPAVKAQILDLKLSTPIPCRCCGKEHETIQNGLLCVQGWVWFNCECGSTLLKK